MVMKNGAWLIVLIFVFSCGSAINYDYDRGADFSVYKTYLYYSDIQSGLSTLDERRLLRALDHRLEVMGYTKSSKPDFIININGNAYETNNASSVGVGVGGTGGSTSGGIGVSVPINNYKTYDEMVIEFVDEKKGTTIWLADVNVVVPNSETPEKRDAYFVNLVNKILSNYPPKSKK